MNAVRHLRPTANGTAHHCGGVEPAARARDFSLFDIVFGTAVFSAVILINRFGLAGNAVFFVIILGMLTLSPFRAFQGLLIGLMALCTNNALVVKTILWAVGRFVLVVFSSARFFFYDAGHARVTLLNDIRYICLCIFCIAVSCTSLAAGNRPDLALMKVLSFWLGLSGLFAGAAVLRVTRQDIAPTVVKIIATASVMCWLALALGVGQNFKTKEFAGNLFNLGFYHSQTLGPMSALMFLYLANVLLLGKYRNRWICLPLMASLFAGLRFSGSRTGGLTLAIGLFTIAILALTWSRSRFFRLRLNIPKPALAGLLVVAALAAVGFDYGTSGTLSRGITSFIAKSGKEEVESVSLQKTMSSRAGLIDRAMTNFRLSPIVGNGFQLYADRSTMADKTFLSSQVEKGFLPAAILEETGVTGAFFLIVLCLSFMWHYYRERNIPGLVMFVAMLAVNLGECIFFSLGGHGALAWALVVSGDLLGDQCRAPLAATALAPRPAPSYEPLSNAVAT